MTRDRDALPPHHLLRFYRAGRGTRRAPTPVPGFDSYLDPSISGLELWLDRAVTPANNMTIYRATRASLDVPFDPGSLAPVTELDSSSNQKDPSLTADGLDIIFMSDRAGAYRLWEATRNDLGQPFGNLHEINELSSTDVGDGLDVSIDGLTVFYADGAKNLRSVHRTIRTGSFGPPSAVLASGVAWPSVSPDLLELFYEGPTGSTIFRLVRTDTGGPFGGTPTPITSGGDPDISPDSTVLVVDVAPGLAVMTRTCN
jgi:hypothetical protein